MGVLLRKQSERFDLLNAAGAGNKYNGQPGLPAAG